MKKWLAFTCLCLGLLSPSARALDPEEARLFLQDLPYDGQISVTVDMRMTKEKFKAAAALLPEFREAIQKNEPDNSVYVWAKSLVEPNRITVFGIWKNKKALLDHVASAHAQEFLTKVKPTLAAPLHITFHEKFE